MNVVIHRLKPLQICNIYTQLAVPLNAPAERT